jgi:uncharacterized protein YqjF (DUF2071 family)
MTDPTFWVATEHIPELAIRPGYKITIMGDRAIIFYEVSTEHLTADHLARSCRRVPSRDAA